MEKYHPKRLVQFQLFLKKKKKKRTGKFFCEKKNIGKRKEKKKKKIMGNKRLFGKILYMVIFCAIEGYKLRYTVI